MGPRDGGGGVANDRDSRDGHGGIGVVVRDAEDRGLGTEELLGPTSLYGGMSGGRQTWLRKGMSIRV